MTAPVAHTTVTIPTFEEGRLCYRAPMPEHFDVYAEFLASPRSRGIGGPFGRADAFRALCSLVGHWHVRGYGRWMLEDRETGEPLGIVGLFYPEGWPEPEIAWSLFESAEGRGIAFEAAKFSRRYAYDVLGWKRVISCCMADNTRSIALAERLGAVREDDFVHPDYGRMRLYRHPGPEVLE